MNDSSHAGDPANECRDWQHGCVLEGTPPCPDGNPQRICELLGFRLKGADYLQLRAVHRDSDQFMCHVTIDEHPDRVCVRLVACVAADTGRRPLSSRDRHETDCPCNVWLDDPLGTRAVIDLDTGEELPLYIPHWDTDEPSEYIPRPPGDLWQRQAELRDPPTAAG
jgi:hypothetical protein